MPERTLVILINISCQFILIFTVTWLGTKVFRIHSASARYCIWLSVALCPLVLLLMNVFVPDLANFEVWNPNLDQNRLKLAKTELDKDLDIDTKANESALTGTSDDLRLESDIMPSVRARIWAKTAPLLVSLWGVGFVISFTLVCAGYIRLNTLVLKAKVVDDGNIIELFKQVKEEIGISRLVQLFISDKARSPFSIGLIHPSVILPEYVSGSVKELKMILIHELIHLKRFDDLINLMCRSISSLMFFHPFYYMTIRELEFATEQICDSWVVKLTERREDYANCLVKLSRACIGRLPVGLGRKGSSMKRRIKSIFRSEEVFRMIGRRNTILLLTLCLLNILFLSSIRLVGFASVEHSNLVFNSSHTYSTGQMYPEILGYISEETENMADSGEIKDLPPTNSNEHFISYYEKAEEAFSMKRYQEAIDNYTKALEEAKKPGVNADALDSDFENLAKYKIAVCYTEIANQTQDSAIYDKALEIIPQVYKSTSTAKIKESVLFLEAKIYYDLKQYEEAEAKFKELVSDYPDGRVIETAYYSLGNIYYTERQYGSSREKFTAILDKYPESEYADDAQYFIARSFFDEGNYEQAHREFQDVKSENNMILAQARYFGSLSLLRLRRNQEALENYEKFVAEFPDSVFVTAAYFDMGTIQARMKEYEEADRNYRQAIQHTKDKLTKGMIQYQIGNNYFDGKNYQRAINAYQELIKQYSDNPNVPEAYFMIAECYWFLKDYKNALDAYIKALNNDRPMSKNTGQIMNQIGQCYSLLGNKEAAMEWFQNVMDKYPEADISIEAAYGKITALKDLKRYEEAEKAGRDFITRYKENPKFVTLPAEIQIILGDIGFDTKDYLAAAKEYLNVESDYPDLPGFASPKCRSMLKAGNAYYKAAEEQDWDQELLTKAISLYEKLIDDYGDLESLSGFIKTAKSDMDMARVKLR